MEATKSGISFMSLSPELRELVYDFALISDETDVNFIDPRNGERGGEIVSLYRKPVICVQKCEVDEFLYDLGEEYTQEGPVFYGWKSEWAKQPALTRVSRQIRAETIPIYYGKNEFAAFAMAPYQSGRVDLQAVKVFLRGIGKRNADLIRKMTFLRPCEWYAHELHDEKLVEVLDPEDLGLAAGSVKMLNANVTYNGRGFGEGPKKPNGFPWSS